MSEIKRYMHSDQRGSVEVVRGKYVLYEDYAELKAQRDALAGENAALKRFINTSCYSYDGDGSDICDSYIGADESPWFPKTPDTDAYLNSVRADAVEKLWSDSLNDVGHVLAEIGAYQDASEAAGIVHSEIQERVSDFAKQLRAGEPS